MAKGTGVDKLVDQHHVGVSIDYNAESFECAGEELLSDSTRLRDIAQRGRRVFSSEFDWPTMEGRLFAVYDQLLDCGESNLTRTGGTNLRK